MNDSVITEHIRSLGADLVLGVKAAAAAAEPIRAGYEKLHQIEEKGVGDLVSEIDRQADLAAGKVLQADTDAAVLSEELNSHTSADHDQLWIVDPLDATAAFLMRVGEQYPAVLVAKRTAGETVLAVVAFPLLNQWFYAVKGRGAWLNGKRLVCDREDVLSQSWVEMNQFGDAQLESEFFGRLRGQLRSARGARLVTSSVPNSGVAMRIAAGHASLAAAVHDNHPLDVKQAAWDIAAPQLIMEEAGGVFLNPAGQRSDPFVPEPVIVARSAALAHEIIRLGEREPASTS